MILNLPGEALSHEEQTAQAHISTIFGCFQLVRAAESPFVDFDMVGTEGRELLSELSWNDGDGSAALRDAAEEHARNMIRGVDYSATWSAGCEFDGQPDSFKAWFSGPGPSCWIAGDFGLHGHVSPHEIFVHYSWAGASSTTRTTATDREALSWLVDLVAC